MTGAEARQLPPTYLKPTEESGMQLPGQKLLVSVDSDGAIDAVNCTPRTDVVDHGTDFVIIYDANLDVLEQVQRALDADGGLGELSREDAIRKATRRVCRLEILNEVVSKPPNIN